MKKQPFSLSLIVSILLAACALALALAIFTRTNDGVYKRSQFYDALNAKLQFYNENADAIKKEEALQLNGLNNGTNQFMINEFKNTYRVRA